MIQPLHNADNTNTHTASANSTERYLRQMFCRTNMVTADLIVREVRCIDFYASREAVLLEAQKRGWKVFASGGHWILISGNQDIHQFKWQLSAVQ